MASTSDEVDTRIEFLHEECMERALRETEDEGTTEEGGGEGESEFTLNNLRGAC
jgi:hypothetical protein